MHGFANEYQSAICQETTGNTVALTYTANDADACLIAACPTMAEYVILKAKEGDADAKIIAQSFGWCPD